MMRLHQIVCGSFKDDEGTLHRIPNNRLETLMETLTQVEEQLREKFSIPKDNFLYKLSIEDE